MVKIRLTRMGNKHRPFYRIVVAKSASARDSAAIEFLGTYDPLTKPSTVNVKADRALHWLMEGAQPTETVAYLLKREGILEEFFAKRPKAKKNYSFLDKRVKSMTQASAVSAPVAEPKTEKAAEPVVEEAPAEPVAEETTVEAVEAPVEETAEVTEAPAAEEKESE